MGANNFPVYNQSALRNDYVASANINGNRSIREYLTSNITIKTKQIVSFLLCVLCGARTTDAECDKKMRNEKWKKNK